MDYAIPQQNIEHTYLAAFLAASYQIIASSSTTMAQGDLDLLREQSWFSTEEWQIGERAASAEIASGDTEFFGSDEEFLASL